MILQPFCSYSMSERFITVMLNDFLFITIMRKCFVIGNFHLCMEYKLLNYITCVVNISKSVFATIMCRSEWLTLYQNFDLAESILGKISVSIIKLRRKEAQSNMKKQGRVLGLRCFLQHYLHVHHDRAMDLAISSEILAANM